MGRQQGIALLETLIGISSLVLVSMGVLYTSGNTLEPGKASQSLNLAAASCNALDQITLDVRHATKVISFSPTRVTLASNGAQITYSFDAASRTLTSWRSDEAQPKVLLRDCERVQFGMYKPSPTPTGFASTSNPGEGKSVSVAWASNRTLMGSKVKGADLPETMIVLRQKQVL